MEHVRKANQDMGPAAIGSEPVDRLSTVETKLRNFHRNGTPFPLEGVTPSEVEIYQKIFGAVARGAPSPRYAREIIDAVLKSVDG